MNGFGRTVFNFLRANFFAGVFIAVPFAITIIFLMWVWGKINGPLAKIFDIAAQDEAPWASIASAIEHSDFGRLFVPILGLAILLFGVLVLGILTRSIVGRTILAGVEGIVAKVPLVGMLYMSLKQLGEAFLTTDGASKFQSAVAVQFPYKGCWAIGFVTGSAATIMRGQRLDAAKENKDLLTVFVPTTPLPTAGFLMMLPESETIPLDMTVQDALKLVVSGGMVGPADGQRKPQGNLTRIMTRDVSQQIGVGRPQSNATEP